MAMVVKTNMSAVRTLNTLNQNSTALQKSLTKVASGMKINGAQDDASGYAISERMRVRIRSLDQANQNSQNDSALMKTAEGAVSNTIEILKALKEKAINAANDSNTEEDRQTIQKEVDQFIDQIDDNALVQFNGKYLVDGSKNNVVSASKTILLNQSLATNTTADSYLTALNNRAGDALEIQSTDKYQVSWVMNGVTMTTSGTVGTETNLTALMKVGGEDKATLTAQSDASPTTIGTDKYNVDVYTPDKAPGVALLSLTTGVTSQISGFTISITDAQGNVKKAANAALDAFKQYQRAENETGDKSLTFHVGSEANVAIKVGIGDMRAEALGLKGSNGSDRVRVTTKENANAAINAIENALAKALDQQTTIGAIEARLEYTSANLTTSSENVQASESTIRDADMAKEMTNYTKNNVLLQSAQAMLAQANQNSSAVLSLLQ
ncbi:MAG: flagellin [Selenomonadaceae bacterium]|nr:flagellin [Selenomonadaceae bacterium]